jgi:hypothetical protein
MEVVHLPVQAGKTEQLIQWLIDAPEDEHRILVSHDLMESHRVMRVAYDRGLIPQQCETWQFICVEELKGPDLWSAVKRFRPGRFVLAFDNLDLWLAKRFPYNIRIVTMTKEESDVLQ